MTLVPANDREPVRGVLAENLVYFARALRTAGMKVGPRDALDAVEAVLAAGIGWQYFWGLVMPAMALMAIGMALVVAPLSAAVMGAVAAIDSGAASGINNALSRVAGLVAVAAMGGVAAASYALAGGACGFRPVAARRNGCRRA